MFPLIINVLICVLLQVQKLLRLVIPLLEKFKIFPQILEVIMTSLGTSDEGIVIANDADTDR